jgi:2-polyprenyl-6-methoxyphenol hydroxylase-like FAD-dependent oxidoreductase
LLFGKIKGTTDAIFGDEIVGLQEQTDCGLLGDAAFCVSLMAGQGSALAMVAAYVLAGELANAGGRHEEAFSKYEEILRPYISSKQQGAERFASIFAPKTRIGLFLRNQVIKAFAIPGLARFAVGNDIIDTLRLPDYRTPAGITHKAGL